jgi:hypothetical protein
MHPAQTARLFSAFIAPSEDFFDRDWARVLPHLLDLYHRPSGIVPVPMLIRYQPRNRLAVTRDQDGLPALDLIQELEQVSLATEA